MKHIKEYISYDKTKIKFKSIKIACSFLLHKMIINLLILILENNYKVEFKNLQIVAN